MPEPTVICLGATVLDRVLVVEKFSSVGVKMRASRWEERGGGPAATAAICIARLGMRASLWSRLGDDHEGQAMLHTLAESGIDLSHARVIAGATTLQSVVIVDGAGERLIIGHPANGAARGDDGELLRGLPTAVTRATAVLADASWVSGAEALFEAARHHSVPSVLDGDLGRGDPELLERLSARADYSVYSEVGWHVLTGLDGPDLAAMRALRDRTDTLPSMTMGDRGSFWLIDDELRHVPAVPVAISDTTGAGDVFHGAFAAALAEGRSVLPAAEFAAATAALKCQLGNGWKGMPERHAVEHLMKEKTP